MHQFTFFVSSQCPNRNARIDSRNYGSLEHTEAQQTITTLQTKRIYSIRFDQFSFNSIFFFSILYSFRPFRPLCYKIISMNLWLPLLLVAHLCVCGYFLHSSYFFLVCIWLFNECSSVGRPSGINFVINQSVLRDQSLTITAMFICPPKNQHESVRLQSV